MSDSSSRPQPQQASRRWEDVKGLSPATLGFVAAQGFIKMTPVQAITIPLFLDNKDVCVEAITGSGKTLAFLIPCVEMLLKTLAASDAPKRQRTHSGVAMATFRIGALVLAPTRELAGQIHEVLSALMRHVADGHGYGGHLRAWLVTGGREVDQECEQIRGAATDRSLEIIVATPGRLSHLLTILSDPDDWTLKSLEVLVMDEADRLLDLGFERHLSDILGRLPKQRRTGLFSATLTTALHQLIKAGLRNPVHICVKVDRPKAQQQDDKQDGEDAAGGAVTHSTPTTLENYYCYMRSDQKLAFLMRFFRTILPESKGKCIVFFLTCACVDFFHKMLLELTKRHDANTNSAAPIPSEQTSGQHPFSLANYPIYRLHGQMAQKGRQKTYQQFVDGSRGILLATDVAARGIDVPDVDWIIQYDAPQDPEFFIHRIGRTARAGRSGRSLVMLLPEETAYIPFLQRRKVELADFASSRLKSAFAGVAARKKRKAPPDDSSLSSEQQLIKDEEAASTLRDAQQVLMEDRAVLEKASAAFVSFVRAYKEHQLAYIFPFQSLSIGHLASSFALLRIPRVKEILGRTIDNFVQSDVDPSTIAFKDPHREAQRQEQLRKKREAKAMESSQTDPKKDRTKAKAVEKRAKDEQKCEESKVYRTRGEKRRAKRKRAAAEWEDLALEERLAKKLRQGKISVEEYERKLRGTEEESDEGDAQPDSDSGSDGSQEGGMDGDKADKDTEGSSDEVDAQEAKIRRRKERLARLADNIKKRPHWAIQRKGKGKRR